MEANNKFSRLRFFEKLASLFTRASGSNAVIIFAFSIVFLWLLWGPFEKFSIHWHLVIHTVTSTITFLMVFIIQKSHNKDALAIQLKLNELLSAHESANNKLVDIENMNEEELKIIQKYYSKLNDFSKKDENNQESNSIINAAEKLEINKEMEKELKEESNK